MANQSEAFEKVVILLSDSDKTFYPNNTVHSFESRIFPIQQNKSYDAFYPISCSVPIKTTPLPPPPPPKPLKGWRLTPYGKTFFQNYTLPLNGGSIDFQCTATNRIGLPIVSRFRVSLNIQFIPILDISEELFSIKPPLDKLFRYSLKSMPMVRQDEATYDFVFFNTCEELCAISYVKSEPLHGEHRGWEIDDIIKNPVQWEVETEEGLDVIVHGITVTDDDLPVINNLKQDQIYTEPGYWTQGDINYFLEVYNNWQSRRTRLNYYGLRMTDVTVNFNNLDKKLWEWYEPSEANEPIDDDNQQIYLYCDQINYSRIANQYERLFMDLHITPSAQNAGRLTEDISIPMYIPFDTVNDLVPRLRFYILNALSEKNTALDEDRKVVVIGKLIKKYFDVTDAKTKIELPELAFS